MAELIEFTLKGGAQGVSGVGSKDEKSFKRQWGQHKEWRHQGLDIFELTVVPFRKG